MAHETHENGNFGANFSATGQENPQFLPLTPRQHTFLKVLDQHLRDKGVCPSYEELGKALELKSRSAVHGLIDSLCKRGYLKREPHQARTLRIVRLPANLRSPNLPASSGTSSGARSGTPSRPPIVRSGGKVAAPVSRGLAKSINIPLMGRVAAGLPIEALSEIGEEISVPASLVDGEDNYALQVEGDSMINAGIHDGDTVVVSSKKYPNPGSIVVALIDYNEATMKHYHRVGKNIELRAANPLYANVTLDFSRVTIQGCVVGLLRRY